MVGLIVKLTQDRLTGEKEVHFGQTHWGTVEMGPKKWTKQAVIFLVSRQRNNEFVKTGQNKET